MVQKKEKPFGIKVELPVGDPFRMTHLLGEDWSGTRWFTTARERDIALAGMIKQPGNYRKGDKPSITVSAIDS